MPSIWIKLLMFPEIIKLARIHRNVSRCLSRYYGVSVQGSVNFYMAFRKHKIDRSFLQVLLVSRAPIYLIAASLVSLIF